MHKNSKSHLTVFLALIVLLATTLQACQPTTVENPLFAQYKQIAYTLELEIELVPCNFVWKATPNPQYVEVDSNQQYCFGWQNFAVELSDLELSTVGQTEWFVVAYTDKNTKGYCLSYSNAPGKEDKKGISNKIRYGQYRQLEKLGVPECSED